MTSGNVEPVEIDIPCDVQQIDDTGHVFTFLDEARDPTRITAGAIVVSGDEDDPVLARVVTLTPMSTGVGAASRSSPAIRTTTSRP